MTTRADTHAHTRTNTAGNSLTARIGDFEPRLLSPYSPYRYDFEIFWGRLENRPGLSIIILHPTLAAFFLSIKKSWLAPSSPLLYWWVLFYLPYSCSFFTERSTSHFPPRCFTFSLPYSCSFLLSEIKAISLTACCSLLLLPASPWRRRRQRSSRLPWTTFCAIEQSLIGYQRSTP